MWHTDCRLLSVLNIGLREACLRSSNRASLTQGARPESDPSARSVGMCSTSQAYFGVSWHRCERDREQRTHGGVVAP